MPHPPFVTVLYNSLGWQQQLGSAMAAGNLLQVRIKGSMASQVCAKIEDFTVKKLPAPPGAPVPVPFPKLHVSAFLVSMPVLASLVLQALTVRGYHIVTATFDAKGAGKSNDELVLHLL
ncbi:MAG: hypothetical protein KIT83_18385 [Bryobacterales bacterium]|nr:hypothetical protein [Bryobacterales bacterium]